MPRKKKRGGLNGMSKGERRRKLLERKRRGEGLSEEMWMRPTERQKVEGGREEPDPLSPGTSSQNSLNEEKITKEKSNVSSTVVSSNSLSQPTPVKFPKKTETQVKKQKQPKAPPRSKKDMDAPPLALTERSQRPLRQARLAAKMRAMQRRKRPKKEIPAIAKLLTLASLQKSGKFCFECFVNGGPSVASFTCCLEDYQGALGHGEIINRKTNLPATVSSGHSGHSLTLSPADIFQNRIRTHFDRTCYKHTQLKIRTQAALTRTQIPQYLSTDIPPLAPGNPFSVPVKTPSCQGVSNPGSLGKEGITKKKRKFPATKSAVNYLNQTTIAELPKIQFENLYFKNKQQKNTMVHPELTPVPIDAEMLAQPHSPKDVTSDPVQVRWPPQRKKRVLMIAEHHRGVVSNMACLWKNGKFCDASIGNGKVTVKVHKLVLYAVCSNLASLPVSNLEYHKFLQLNFPEEVGWEALNAFAVYMYYGILDMNCDVLQQLKIIAKKLDMKEFGTLCNTCLEKQMPQPTATTAASSNDGPLNQPSIQVPSMTSSPPSLSSTISAPVQSAPSIATQVIDVKQEIPESNPGSEVASLAPDMSVTTQLIDTKQEIPESNPGSEVASLAPNMSVTTQLIDTKQEIPESNPESEVASLAPNTSSANADGFGIYPRVKIEQVGPEDNRYVYPSSNSYRTFTETDSSSSSSSLTAPAAASKSITSVPAPQREFAIPFSETKDVKSESYTNFPLFQTSKQFPSMISSLPSLSSTISAPIQSTPAINTPVIDVKQENSEANLAPVRNDTAAVSSQESEVASLTLNKSANSAGFVICPSIKAEQVGPEDDKYDHLSSKQTFTSTLPSSSSSSLTAPTRSNTSVPPSQKEFAIPFSKIKDVLSTHNNNEMFPMAYPSSSSLTALTRSNTLVPASQKEFAIPVSETADVKSTKLKASHPYESPLVSDLSPAPCIMDCSQSSHMTETISTPLSPLSNSSSVNLPTMSDKSVYPVKLFKSVTNNLPP